MSRLIPVILMLSALVGCADIRGVDEGESALLSESERSVVREQADKARAAGRWPQAWNQEIDAGADRSRLEEIAIDALADRSPDAKGMFEALFEKWGDLTPSGRDRVASLVNEAVGERDWTRAIDIDIAAANDVPEFSAAWATYQASPPYKGPELLERIKRARENAD